MSNTLECRNNLANDQTDTGQNDVTAASERPRAAQTIQLVVVFGTNVQQVAEVLKACMWVRGKLCSSSSCRYQG